MNKKIKNDNYDKERLLFASLGGLGKIGTNMYLYGYKGKWLVVDFGIGFPDKNTYDLDIIFPDISFLEEIKEDIVGIVLTHAHEDHLGALPYLWDKIKKPIYSTNFTSVVARNKLGFFDEKYDNIFNIINTGASFKVEPFNLEFVNFTHSCPESQGIIFKTKNENVLHTGDWKLDNDPVIGDKTDLEKLKNFEFSTVIGDSTNCLCDNDFTHSEKDVYYGLKKVIEKQKGRIFVTCFASNIARITSLCKIAKELNKKVVLMGRSLFRMTECAKIAGYQFDVEKFYKDNEVLEENNSNLLYIATGSQGEERAALMRMAMNNFRNVKLGKTDSIIFSSRVIPGNEKSILKMQNQLTNMKCNVITASSVDDNSPIHASGHGNNKEVKELLKVTKPKNLIPMHGEEIHMQGHIKIAEKFKIKTHLLCDGDLVQISSGNVEKIDSLFTGILTNLGNQTVALDSDFIYERKIMAKSGLLTLSIALDEYNDVLGDINISVRGIKMPNKLYEKIEDIVFDEIDRNNKKSKSKIISFIRRSVGKLMFKKIKLKPEIIIHVIEV